MDLQALKGYRFAERRWSFDLARAYALDDAIGLSLPDEPPRANRPLPPTLAFSADMDHRVVNHLFALTGLQAHQLLHGEQHFVYHQPLQPNLVYHSRATLCEVVQKPRFNLLHKQTWLFAPDGAPVCEMLSVYVALPSPGAPVSGSPMGADWGTPTLAAALSREHIQAFASASGDDNRVHLNPLIARRAGHADVFAQGMLGMGLLGRLLPSTGLRRFGVRFLSPLPLNDRPQIYQRGTARRELLLTNEQGAIRIAGYAVLHPLRHETDSTNSLERPHDGFVRPAQPE